MALIMSIRTSDWSRTCAGRYKGARREAWRAQESYYSGDPVGHPVPADTADLFTEVSRETDKQPWFLEAHLHAKR